MTITFDNLKSLYESNKHLPIEQYLPKYYQLMIDNDISAKVILLYFWVFCFMKETDKINKISDLLSIFEKEVINIVSECYDSKSICYQAAIEFRNHYHATAMDTFLSQRNFIEKAQAAIVNCNAELRIEEFREDLIMFDLACKEFDRIHKTTLSLPQLYDGMEKIQNIAMKPFMIVSVIEKGADNSTSVMAKAKLKAEQKKKNLNG